MSDTLETSPSPLNEEKKVDEVQEAYEKPFETPKDKLIPPSMMVDSTTCVAAFRADAFTPLFGFEERTTEYQGVVDRSVKTAIKCDDGFTLVRLIV